MRTTFKGGCHCGTIRYVYTWPFSSPPPLRRCCCTFCTKHGAIYSAHPEASLAAFLSDGAQVSRYQFSTRTATFFICCRCGVAPFVTSLIEGRDYAVVNMNSLDNPFSAPSSDILDFDGETSVEREERRKRTWIGDVSIIDGSLNKDSGFIAIGDEWI